MENFVSFRSAGRILAGVLHQPDMKKARKFPGIIMCHGFTGCKREDHFIFVKAARSLTSSGFAVLRFDFNGSGDSEGKFEEMTIPSEVEDARNALKFMMKQPCADKNNLGLLGLSLGGMVSSCVAHEFPQIKSLVLWGAPSTYKHVYHLLPQEKHNKFPIDLRGNLVGRNFFDTLPSIDPQGNLAKYKNPVMIVHGSKDQTVPPFHAENLYKAATGVKKLTLIKEADHTFPSAKHETEVINVTQEWFEQTLIHIN